MQQDENKVDLRRFWRAVRQWKWAIICVIVLFTAAGAWMGFRKLTKDNIQGQMLIGEIDYDQNSRGGGIAQMMKTFSVGGFSASTVDNEVLIMQSHDVMLSTVRTLGLNRTYVGKDKEGEKAQLYRNTPVRVEAPAELFDTLSTGFNINIEIRDNGKVDIKATKGFFKKIIGELNGVTLPTMLKTPYGSFQIMATDMFKNSPYRTINVAVAGNEAAATALYEESTIEVANKLSDIINIDYPCANAELGKATVNGIMTEYNAKRLDRLHEAAVTSIKYYDERIAETFKVLQNAEKEVSEYQRKNELIGVDSELELLVGEAVNSKSAIQTANYNIIYYETVLNILRNRLDDDVLIPQMESLGDPNIGAFNGAIQARRELRRSATEDNEALILLNEKIEELRNLIIENSTKMIAKAKSDLGHTQGLAATAQNRLDKYPNYQLEFMNLLRDKEYQNQLYQFLVSQRENSVLQLYSSTNIGFIFQEAYVAKKGSIFKKFIWPIAFCIFSIFCCICWALFIMLITHKVKDPMDLASIGIEAHSVKYTGNTEALSHIRNLILANNDTRVIYFNALSGTEPMLRKFADSLTAIGRNVEVLEGFSTNDEILTPIAKQQVKDALKDNDYVIVNVTEPNKVSDLINALESKDAVLLLTLPCGKINRSKLKAILKGQTANKIYSIICQ